MSRIASFPFWFLSLAVLLLSSSAAAEEAPLSESDFDRHARRVVPRDAFPVLFDPAMIRPSQVGRRLSDEDLVIGVAHGGVAKAYPVQVMGVHELVNDTLGDLAIAASW